HRDNEEGLSSDLLFFLVSCFLKVVVPMYCLYRLLLPGSATLTALHARCRDVIDGQIDSGHVAKINNVSPVLPHPSPRLFSHTPPHLVPTRICIAPSSTGVE
ncbi:unnamed protein product, partial [Ectocarpus sp. 4 AP-2014]